MDRAAALTEDDPRYKEIFGVENEIKHMGQVLIEDPYLDFDKLRAKGPLYRGSIQEYFTGNAGDSHYQKARPHITTLSFQACSQALIENETYTSELYTEQHGLIHVLGRTILMMAGAEHRRYRDSMQPMMTRKHAMEWWRTKWIDPFVDVLMNELRGESHADLSMQLCARLPMHTVSAAYGLDSADALDFRSNLLDCLSPLPTPEQRAASMATVQRILLTAIEARRLDPRDDLISQLINADLKDENGEITRLTNEDIIAFSKLLLLAGGGTTVRQLGITLFALLNDREQFEAVRADRNLMSAAIEESVRWNCTDPVFHRLSTKDSILDGEEVPADCVIDVCLAAGNRDPQRWENPHKYDLHRPPQRHVGFAGGPHTCLGRFVAIEELTSAINALMDRFPNIRLDDEVPTPRIIGALQQRGVDHLRVRLD